MATCKIAGYQRGFVIHIGEIHMKHINTFKYNKLTEGTRKYSPFMFKFWLWGFAYTYETRKKIGGFVIARNAGVPAIDVKSDAFRRKHPKA